MVELASYFLVGSSRHRGRSWWIPAMNQLGGSSFSWRTIPSFVDHDGSWLGVPRLTQDTIWCDLMWFFMWCSVDFRCSEKPTRLEWTQIGLQPGPADLDLNRGCHRIVSLDWLEGKPYRNFHVFPMKYYEMWPGSCNISLKPIHWLLGLIKFDLSSWVCHQTWESSLNWTAGLMRFDWMHVYQKLSMMCKSIVKQTIGLCADYI